MRLQPASPGPHRTAVRPRVCQLHVLPTKLVSDPNREHAWKIHLWSFLTGSEHPDFSALDNITAEFKPPRDPGNPDEEYDSDEPYEIDPDEDEV